MALFDWSGIDDHEFARLVGDLLARLGFIDVDYAGVGPDGGVDLLATELVPYTMQGKRSLRWLVQCKFSANGAAKAVKDNEIKDVQGILRSDRFAAQRPGGYMVVTNRKIANNVVERLRGIDRDSRYRSAWVDCTRLEQLLADHPEVQELYFGTDSCRLPSLGPPEAIVSPRSGFSGAPRVTVRVGVPGTDRNTMVEATLDSGASCTVIPFRLVKELKLRARSIVALRGFDGDTRRWAQYYVTMQIQNLPPRNARVVAVPRRRTGLIGWDILSGYRVLFDHRGAVRLWA